MTKKKTPNELRIRNSTAEFLTFVYSVTEEFSVTAKIAKDYAESEFEKYRTIQDRLFQSDFDRFVELERQADIKDQE